MLAIRMQRTGRSGHTQFRVIVQDSRFSPTRGRVVAYLGSYDPHTKTTTLDGEKASQYLSNGAQPSDRVARLLKKEGVKLPDWVKLEQPQAGATRNPDKRRSTRPEEPKAPEAEVTSADTEETAPTEETPVETPAEDTPAEETDAAPAHVEETSEEAPAEEPTFEETAPTEETPAEN